MMLKAVHAVMFPNQMRTITGAGRTYFRSKTYFSSLLYLVKSVIKLKLCISAFLILYIIMLE